MFCRQCGKEVDENANFCANCGAKLEKEQAQPPVEEVVQEKSVDDVWETSVQDETAQAVENQSEQKDESVQTNDMAIIGFVSSFVSPLMGIVFGGIGLSRAMKRKGKGKGFAIAALAVGAANFLLGVMANACYSCAQFMLI